MRSKLKPTIAVVLVALMLLLAGCTAQPSDQSSQDQEEPLKIGAILALTGNLAVLNKPFQRGMKLAAKDMREEGKNVKVIYKDSRGQPQQGLSAYEQLTSVEGVDALITSHSRVSVPIMSQADKDKIPQIMSMTGKSNLPENSSYAFRFFFQNSEIAKIPYNSVVESGDTVAILHMNDEAGVSMKRGLVDQAEANGVEVVAIEKFSPTAKDYKTQLTKIKEANPDHLLYVGASPIHHINILDQAETLNLNATIFETFGTLTLGPILNKVGLDRAEGVYAIGLPFQVRNISNDFRRKYRNEYEKEPVFLSTFGYDAVKMLAEATGGKSMSGDEIVQRLQSQGTYESLNGPMEVEESGEINPPAVPVRIVDGKLVELNK